jgi:hypothetical protein
MNCPHCGATGQSGRFCTRCRKPLTGQAAAPRVPMQGAARRSTGSPARSGERPVVVDRLSTLMLLQAAFAAGYIILIPRTLTFVIMGGLFVVSLLAAVGLRQLKAWGRVLGILYAVVTLLGIPVGTLFGGFLLAYLFKPEVKAAFSDDPASRRLAGQATDLWRPFSVVIGVGNILLALGLVGLVAALLVPRFLR